MKKNYLNIGKNKYMGLVKKKLNDVDKQLSIRNYRTSDQDTKQQSL